MCYGPWLEFISWENITIFGTDKLLGFPLMPGVFAFIKFQNSETCYECYERQKSPSVCTRSIFQTTQPIDVKLGR